MNMRGATFGFVGSGGRGWRDVHGQGDDHAPAGLLDGGGEVPAAGQRQQAALAEPRSGWAIGVPVSSTRSTGSMLPVSKSATVAVNRLGPAAPGVTSSETLTVVAQSLPVAWRAGVAAGPGRAAPAAVGTPGASWLSRAAAASTAAARPSSAPTPRRSRAAARRRDPVVNRGTIR